MAISTDGLSCRVQAGAAEKENTAAAAPETIAEEPEAEAAANGEPAVEQAAEA